MVPPLGQTQPDSRRWQIIGLLAKQGPMTVTELTESLGVTRTAVRQQVMPLMVEGLLERSHRQQATGRPADVFALSDRGRQLFAQEVGEFTQLLLREIAESEGPAKLRLLIEGVFQRMARKLKPLLGEGTPTEQLDRLAQLLSEHGIASDVQHAGKDLSLTVYSCPYHGLAGDYPEICEMEQRAYNELLGNQTELAQCILKGHGHCEFRLSGAEDDAVAGACGGA